MNAGVRFENRELLARHPGCREYILTVDSLERPLEAMIQSTLSVVPIAPSENAFFQEGADLLKEKRILIHSALQSLSELMEFDLPNSWGDAGTRGDPNAIRAVCQQVLRSSQCLVDAERKVLRTPMHPNWVSLQPHFKGVAHENLSRLLQLVRNIREAVMRGGKGTLEMEIIFTAQQLKEINIPEIHFEEILYDFIGPADCSSSSASITGVLDYVLKELTQPKTLHPFLRVMFWTLVLALFWWILIPIWAIRWMTGSKESFLKSFC
jgi:hypothetical protein